MEREKEKERALGRARVDDDVNMRREAAAAAISRLKAQYIPKGQGWNKGTLSPSTNKTFTGEDFG